MFWTPPSARRRFKPTEQTRAITPGLVRMRLAFLPRVTSRIMGTVLNAPVRADGTANDVGPVTGLVWESVDLLAQGPQAVAGVFDVGQARHPGDTAG